MSVTSLVTENIPKPKQIETITKGFIFLFFQKYCLKNT